ncbi:Sporulation factor SpoIIGA [compost metagenome]
MASVEVEIKGHRLSCVGLVDTGNQLYDPLTKTPVMIAEAKLWKDVLPKEWLKRMQTQDAESIVAAMGEEEFEWQDRLRIVPYRGVNRSTQFMLAIRPDKVQLQYAGRNWETRKVLIGFDGGQLSADGSYQAIIHPMLLSD